MLGQIRQDHQAHIASCGGVWEAPDPCTSRANGIPVEDAVVQLQLELQMVQSQLRSDAASVARRTFESYEDSLKWMVAHCSLDDWQYVMDMPALYSLVRPDGQVCDTLLEEESNFNKAGYASPTQVRLALSIKTKVPGILGGGGVTRNGHPFAVVDVCDNCVSTGTHKLFWDQVEVAVKSLETALLRKMGVHLVHTPDAQRIFHFPHFVDRFCATDVEVAQDDGLPVHTVPYCIGVAI
jgi:hypothetical protein